MLMLAVFAFTNFLFEVQPIQKKRCTKKGVCKPEKIGFIHDLFLHRQKETGRAEKDADEKTGPVLLINSKADSDYAEFFKHIGQTFQLFFKFHSKKYSNAFTNCKMSGQI